MLHSYKNHSRLHTVNAHKTKARLPQRVVFAGPSSAMCWISRSTLMVLWLPEECLDLGTCIAFWALLLFHCVCLVLLLYFFRRDYCRTREELVLKGVSMYVNRFLLVSTVPMEALLHWPPQWVKGTLTLVIFSLVFYLFRMLLSMAISAITITCNTCLWGTQVLGRFSRIFCV